MIRSKHMLHFLKVGDGDSIVIGPFLPSFTMSESYLSIQFQGRSSRYHVSVRSFEGDGTRTSPPLTAIQTKVQDRG